MKKIGLWLTIIFLPMVLVAMEKKIEKKDENLDNKKKFARCIKKIKKDMAKKEQERMLDLLKKISQKFSTFAQNNTAYEKLVKKALKLLKEPRPQKTIIINKKIEELTEIPLNPEHLTIAAASDDKIPDFLLHAVLIYAGTKYAKELFERPAIINALILGKNAQKHLPFPMPHKKKLTFKIPDDISSMPVFDASGIFVAVPGKKCVSIFNTNSSVERPIYKFKKMEEANITLTGLNLKNKTLSGKLPDGNTITYFNIHKYNSSDAIPDVMVTKENNNTPQPTEALSYFTLGPVQTITTNTPSATQPYFPNTPRPKKSPNTSSVINTVFTSLPTNTDISPLPPYINRFAAVKIVQSGATHFLDLETNKNFVADDDTENVIPASYALLNKYGTCGVISPNNKSLNVYSFVTMLSLAKWFLAFCLRYGKLSNPVKITTPAAIKVFESFSPAEQKYLAKTYGVITLKKKLSQSSIPPLKLSKLAGKLIDSDGDHRDGDGHNSAR
ncbi:MAG: hypothetical protein M1426_01520 [Patescibacteria group bacterium]|nr:hypothetical protein [Patescibacteria group bacterium]